AAEMRAGEEAGLAQEIREAGTRLDLGRDRRAVDSEREKHQAACASARLSATACWRRSTASRPLSVSADSTASGAALSPSSSPGGPPTAPITARRMPRAASTSTAAMAKANSPGLRQAL